MRDGWSSFTDTEADHRTLSDQLFQVRDLVSVRVEKLDAKGYSASFSEELAKDLSRVRRSLTAFDSGLQFTKDLGVANQLVATRSDHRNVAVLRFCLQRLATYIAEIAGTGEDKPSILITAFNELAALYKKPLLSENLFTVPDEYRVDFHHLRCENTDSDASSADSYLSLSQTMLGIYRGESREKKLKQLSESFERIADQSSHRKAQCFWLLCSVYTQSVEIPTGELRPALFKIYKEIENILVYAKGDDQSQVLGIQQNVDKLLCNMLCYLSDGAANNHQAAIEAEFRFGSVFPELNQLHLSTPKPLLSWLQSSIGVLTERLQHCGTLLSENALQSDELVEEFIEEVAALKRLMVVIGVHGARANLEEVEGYLRESVTVKSMSSSSTSIQLVEQQMLYQFPALADTVAVADDEVIDKEVIDKEVIDKEVIDKEVIDKEVIDKDVIAKDVAEKNVIDGAETDGHVIDRSGSAIREPGSYTADNSTTDFGTRCNSCIDVIQQSLDTALGSSGNLIPDSSVINALSKLNNLVSDKGIDELTSLLTPLSQLLNKAENSTLNQSETLLVQEAIIAATLGIDSLVGHKPMPDLIHDVTIRVENILAAASQRLSNGASRNGVLNGFLVEAEELLPRLFELFQRLRGAPEGASRLYADINRLLHTFKHSADEASQHELASLVHYLESTMVDLTQSAEPPSAAFFDLALESIECLDEDINRLRNSERTEDRSELIDRLKLAGGADLQRPLSSSGSRSAASLRVSHDQLPEDAAADSPGEPVVVVPDEFNHAAGIDWSQRLQQLEKHYEAINTSHNKLVELQSKLDQTIQTASKDQHGSTTTEHFHPLAEQLQQAVNNQTTAIRQLGRAFNTASAIEASLLGGPLRNAVTNSARANNLRVQLRFEPGDAVIHRSLFDTLTEALDVLLRGIVAYTIPAADREAAQHTAGSLPTLTTITVRVQQNAEATIIEVADDGCGVTVQDAEFRSDNPWRQVTRPDWRETGTHQRKERPAVWSKQTDHQVDVSGLLDIATKSGGSVAVCSDESGSRYRLCLPEFTHFREVLVFEVSGRQLAVSVEEIDSVGLASNLDALALSHLLGLQKQAALDKNAGSHSIVCRTTSGLQRFLVDNVIGHQTLQFESADRILPDVPGYKGVATDESGQLLLLIDTGYWAAQQG